MYGELVDGKVNCNNDSLAFRFCSFDKEETDISISRQKRLLISKLNMQRIDSCPIGSRLDVKK